MGDNSFVYVVCGDAVHIETLELSHNILSKKAKYPIVIVTDVNRNQKKINLPNLIHYDTPAEFTHHQASIFLKTNLHKILPPGKTYAYLDTDLLAYGSSINSLFDQFNSPITFGADHCKLQQFSCYAINCNCLDTANTYREKMYAIMSEVDPLFNQNQISGNEFINAERIKLYKEFEKAKKLALPGRIFKLAKFVLSWPTYRISPDFYFDRRKKIWYNNDQVPIMYHISNRKLAKRAGLKWNPYSNDIELPDGRSLWKDQCDHLSEAIDNKFNIKVFDKNWQHWNGGVFLFSDQSQEFMDTWHHFTMEIFKDPKWKTRDQGTLIATVWKLGLQNHPTIDIKWNMILDYHNPKLDINEEAKITIDGENFIAPEFVHIYHHWNDNTWTLWNQIITHITKKNVG